MLNKFYKAMEQQLSMILQNLLLDKINSLNKIQELKLTIIKIWLFKQRDNFKIDVKINN